MANVYTNQESTTWQIYTLIKKA